ncbi:MAG: hypothetical protein KGZ79_15285 [Dethiobacter sp.]|jgi:hypothetical protein|nr:hypothetical protein [Dethiobacter sp.]
MDKKRGLYIILLFIAVSTILLWIAPAEQTLGKLIKLIYVHMAMSYISLYTFYAAAALGAVHMATSQVAFGLWSRELGWSALILWFVSFLLSLVSMQVIWGGLVWREPMTIAAVTILILGIGKEVVCRGGTLKLRSAANIVFAAAILVIRSNSGRLMHPDNPIRGSDSVLIRILPVILLVLAMAALFEFTRWRLRNVQKSETVKNP